MSKSLGNYVGISEPPAEMFGKLMSLSDEMMPVYYELCTDVPMDDVAVLTNSAQTHPREAKKRLAREIITLYHSMRTPRRRRTTSSSGYIKSIKRRTTSLSLPFPPRFATPTAMPACHRALLVAAKLAPSSGEAKRLILGGGVSIDGEKIMDAAATVRVQTGQVIKVGRNRFVQLVPRLPEPEIIAAELYRKPHGRIGSRMAELETQPMVLEPALS